MIRRLRRLSTSCRAWLRDVKIMWTSVMAMLKPPLSLDYARVLNEVKLTYWCIFHSCHHATYQSAMPKVFKRQSSSRLCCKGG